MSAGIVLAGLFCLVATGKAEERVVNRYPYDPACRWGRLSDGKGMIIRCLTETEATQLGVTKLTPPASAPLATSAETTNKNGEADSHPELFDVELVGVTADEGTLPIARRKLGVPKDRYRQCVADNGGLVSASGEVSVRFLVRERGRAEGTSVEKHSGVTEAAAKCIAAVVDRRPVGTPEGPAVGATAVFRVTRASKRRSDGTGQ
jgi:hypothetical protein